MSFRAEFYLANVTLKAAILAAGAAVILSAATARAASAPRIVSLAPSITETLFALGVGPDVVGVSQYCDYPPKVRALPKVGSFLTPNLEAILSLRPTLIIGLRSASNQRELRALAAGGYPIITVEEDSVADIKASIETIGAAVGAEEQARQLIGAIDRHFEMVEDAVRNLPKPRVLMVVGHNPMVAVGQRTFLGELLKTAGAVNIAAASAQAWPRLSLEFVVAMAPEVIIDGQMGSESAQGDYWSKYPSLPAVAKGRVYGYNSNPMLRPGPRIWQSLLQLARLIHPEAVAAIAATQQGHD